MTASVGASSSGPSISSARPEEERGVCPSMLSTRQPKTGFGHSRLATRNGSVMRDSDSIGNPSPMTMVIIFTFNQAIFSFD